MSKTKMTSQIKIELFLLANTFDGAIPGTIIIYISIGSDIAAPVIAKSRCSDKENKVNKLIPIFMKYRGHMLFPTPQPEWAEQPYNSKKIALI